MSLTGWLGTSDSYSGNLLNGFDSIQPETIPNADLYAVVQADPFVRWRKRQQRGRAWMEPLACVLDPVNLISPEALTMDKFDTRWAMPYAPRRRRPPAHALYTAAILEATLIPEAPEGGTVRPWFAAFEQPEHTRRSPGRRPRPWYQWTALEMDEADRPERIGPDKFESLPTLPVAILRRRERGHRYPYAVLEMDAADRPEFIGPDKWRTPLSEPARRLRRPIRTANVHLGALQIDSWDEEVVIGKFYTPLSRHPGKKPLPRRPWNVAIGELFDEALFEVPVFVRLHRPFYRGGY